MSLQDILTATECSEKGRFTADEPGGLGETLFLKAGGSRYNRQENTIKSREGKPTHFMPLYFFLLKRRFFYGLIDSQDISQQGASLSWQPSQSQRLPPGSPVPEPQLRTKLRSTALNNSADSDIIANMKPGVLRQVIISVQKKNIAQSKVMKFIHKPHSYFNRFCHIRCSQIAAR